jgi:hypothetical protein
MIDRRLCDEDGDELERELIVSMRADCPSPEARRRMLATLGLVGVGTAMGSTAIVAKKGLAALLASKGIHAIFGKTALILASVGVAALAVTVAIRKPTAPTTTPVATMAPSVSVAVPDPAASTIPSAIAAPAPSSSAPAEKPKTPSASVAEAIALLDAARKALDSGDMAGAVSQLDRYDGRFPKGPLRPEADLLRIETLVRRGDRAAARALADALAIQLPGSAHAQRARDLVDATDP